MTGDSITEKHIDDQGYLLKPSVHDAEVIGIALPPASRNLIIEVITESKQRYKFFLNDLVFLKCNGLSIQNVISDLFIRTGPMALGRLREIFKELHWLKPEDFDSLEAEIQINRAFIFDLIPSTGADLACLCRSFEIFQDS